MYETDDTVESSAWFATDGLAMPDDNDASSRVLLLDGFAILGAPAYGSGARDDDDSFGALSLICTADTTGYFGIKSKGGTTPSRWRLRPAT